MLVDIPISSWYIFISAREGTLQIAKTTIFDSSREIKNQILVSSQYYPMTTTNTPAPSAPTPTPATLAPTPQGQLPNQTAQEKISEKEFSDTQNRERIAVYVLWASIASITLISGVAVWFASDKTTTAKDIFNSLLPLYGTWVGTILAFYFSRNAFEAASSASNRSFQQATSGSASASPPPDNVLAKILLKSLANNLIFSENNLNKPLQEVLNNLNDKGRYRLIVVDAAKKYVDIVYRVNVATYLANPGGGQQVNPPPQPPTLDQYIKFRDAQGAKLRVVFLPENATLADADAKLKETTGCRDVIVTADGQPTSPVVAYVTDIDINEYR
jgi:hypothetical protein